MVMELLVLAGILITQPTFGMVTSQPCGDPPTVSNATVEVNETAVPYVAAKYTCDAANGYVLTGNDTIYCFNAFQMNIWSSSQFTCTRIQCSEDPYANSNHTTTNFETTSTESYREFVEDYNYYDYQSHRYGYWRTRYRAAVQSQNVYYGQNITSYCKTGYEHPDRSTTASVECSINGTWIYPPTECQKKDCGTVENMTGVVCDVPSTVYQSVARCRCKGGYERKYLYSSRRTYTDNSFTMTCGSNSQWSRPDDGRQNNCTRVQCPALRQNIPNMVSLNFTGTSYEDTALYTCIPGYETNITGSIWCQANKTWSSSVSCVRKDCGSPPILMNGYVTHYVYTTTFQSNATYGCSRGYKLDGASTITCNEEGVWTTPPICHRIRCNEPPEIQNGRRHVGGHYYGDSTVYECDIAYLLSGNSSISCQFDGHWSAKPECHVVSCGRPPYVEHGSFKVTSGYKFTDHVEYTCFNDFMLNGVNFAVCLSNGSWSKPPSCLPAARSATTQISPSSLLASTAATFPMVKSTATPSRAVSETERAIFPISNTIKTYGRTTRTQTDTGRTTRTQTDTDHIYNTLGLTRISQESKSEQYASLPPSQVHKSLASKHNSAISGSHQSGLVVGVAVLAAVLFVVLVAIGVRRTLKARRLRAERRNECPAAVENALYTCEGETMTVYSFKHNKTTED